MFRQEGSSEDRNQRSVAPRYGFKHPRRACKGELSYQKWRETRAAAFPSQRKREIRASDDFSHFFGDYPFTSPMKSSMKLHSTQRANWNSKPGSYDAG